MKKFDLSYNDIKKKYNKPNNNQGNNSNKSKSIKNKSKSTNNQLKNTKNQSFGKKLKSILKSKKFKRTTLKIVVVCFGLGLIFTIGIFAYFSKDLPSPGIINQ